MRILAIDTSVGAGSVAAVDDAGHADRPLGPAGSHARLLTAALAELVLQRGWSGDGAPLRCLGPDDVIAVVRGPGSFTGLRVGVTTAKALAWASGARLVAVSGFEAAAARAARLADWAGAELEIAYDAGRGDTFAALVTPAGPLWHVGAPRLLAVDQWLATLPRCRRVSGPGLDAIADHIVASRGDLQVAPSDVRHPEAYDAAVIARSRAASGWRDDPESLVPEYLRPSYAEERRATGG